MFKEVSFNRQQGNGFSGALENVWGTLPKAQLSSGLLNRKGKWGKWVHRCQVNQVLGFYSGTHLLHL